MFFDTFWALVLGFTLSGAVQAFVSRAAMQRSLGDHRPRTVAKAVLLRHGLVVVLVRRFGACQVVVRSRRRLHGSAGLHVRLHQPGGRARHRAVAAHRLAVRGGGVRRRRYHDRAAGLVLPQVSSADIDAARSGSPRCRPWCGRPARRARGTGSSRTGPGGSRVRTRAGWSDASGYTISDLTMLRKEIVIGFVDRRLCRGRWCRRRVWRAVFVTGHGFWSTLENAVVGPFIAVISFVCSVGNVPLAAALWQGGISFGGVVSFRLRRPDRLPAPGHLPQVLRHGAHPAATGRLLGDHVGCGPR